MGWCEFKLDYEHRFWGDLQADGEHTRESWLMGEVWDGYAAASYRIHYRKGLTERSRYINLRKRDSLFGFNFISSGQEILQGSPDLPTFITPPAKHYWVGS